MVGPCREPRCSQPRHEGPAAVPAFARLRRGGAQALRALAQPGGLASALVGTLSLCHGEPMLAVEQPVGLLASQHRVLDATIFRRGSA
jgi:hypothetical protein